jgi:hypothetical protein
VPSAENPGVSHAAEKLRAFAERAPEIENDLRQMADDLDARMRQPTALSGTPRQGGGSATANQASPGLKIRALTSVLEVIAPTLGGQPHGWKTHSAAGR